MIAAIGRQGEPVLDDHSAARLPLPMACYAAAMSREERAERRRAQWAHGRVSAAANGDLDPAFWSRATAAERLEAVWQMAKQWWQNEHPDGPPLLPEPFRRSKRLGTWTSCGWAIPPLASTS